jgi:hypothetical protein
MSTSSDFASKIPTSVPKDCLQSAVCNTCTKDLPLTAFTRTDGGKIRGDCESCRADKHKSADDASFKALAVATQRALIEEVNDARNKATEVALKHSVPYLTLNRWIRRGLLAPPPIEWET